MIVPLRPNSPKNLAKEADRGFKMPAYRKRKGYDQAIVTLTDSVTGKRRDYWLGTYGTRESRETYLRVITQWVAECRRFPDRPGEGRAAGKNATSPAEQVTVAEVIAAYWAWAKDSYRRTDAGTLKVALRLLRQFYGTLPVPELGPSKLCVLRNAMTKGDEREGPAETRLGWNDGTTLPWRVACGERSTVWQECPRDGERALLRFRQGDGKSRGRGPTAASRRRVVSRIRKPTRSCVGGEPVRDCEETANDRRRGPRASRAQ